MGSAPEADRPARNAPQGDRSIDVTDSTDALNSMPVRLPQPAARFPTQHVPAQHAHPPALPVDRCVDRRRRAWQAHVWFGLNDDSVGALAQEQSDDGFVQVQVEGGRPAGDPFEELTQPQPQKAVLLSELEGEQPAARRSQLPARSASAMLNGHLECTTAMPSPSLSGSSLSGVPSPSASLVLHSVASEMPSLSASPLPSSASGDPSPSESRWSRMPSPSKRPSLSVLAFALAALALALFVGMAVEMPEHMEECPWDDYLAALARGQARAAPAQPRMLVVSSDNDLADEFRRNAEANPNAVPGGLPLFDKLVYNTYNKLYSIESGACTWRRSSLHADDLAPVLKRYSRVVAIQSAEPGNFNRSPFKIPPYTDNGVRHASGAAALTVLLVDVDCRRMRTIMTDTYREAFIERDCLSDGPGRTESFEAFAHSVGINKGGLVEGTTFVDVPVGLSAVELLRKAVHPTKAQARRARGDPLMVGDFMTDLDALRDELHSRPYSLFTEASKRAAVAIRFPRFQVGVVGLAAAGKSTTLRWLGYYAGLNKTTRHAFQSAPSGGESFTRNLISRGMAENQDDAGFVVYDTMGLDPPLNASVAKRGVVWLAEGRVNTTQEMRWLGEGGEHVKEEPWSFFRWLSSWLCAAYSLIFGGGAARGANEDAYAPWNNEPSADRRFHALVFVQRYVHPQDWKTLDMVKAFVKALRTSMVPLGVSLTVAMTHVEQCQKGLSTRQCTRAFAENIDVGTDQVVALPKTGWARPHAQDTIGGLDGTIEEEVDDAGTYVEPDGLLRLVRKVKAASRRYYDQNM